MKILRQARLADEPVGDAENKTGSPPTGQQPDAKDGETELPEVSSPLHYQVDPHATLTTSLLGALRLSEHARLRRCRIVHASTSGSIRFQ